MIKIKKNKKDIIRAWDYLVVAFTIYITDAMVFSTNINTVIPIIARYVMVAATLFIIAITYINKKRIVLTKEDILPIVMIGFIFCTAIINDDFSKKLLSKCLVILFGFNFSKYYSFERYSKIYLKLMTLISITSIVMYFGINILRLIPGMPVIQNVSGVKFYTVFISNIYYNWPGPILRITGPFWEPGVFQLYLIIAIVFVSVSKDVYNKNKIVNIILYVTTLILTFSTTAIVALIPLLISILFLSKNFIRPWLKWVIVIAGAIAIFLIFNNETIYNVLFSKMTDANNISYNSRFNSITEGFKAFLDNPLFGVGPVKLEQTMLGYSIVNTVIMHFSIYGLFIGLFFLWKLFYFSRNCSQNIAVAILIFSVILISISNENFVYSLMINLIVFLKPEHKFYGVMRTKPEPSCVNK